jgi:hypothetical protein
MDNARTPIQDAADQGDPVVTTFAERIKEEAQAEVARLTEFRSSLQLALREADRELAEAQAILASASGKAAPEPTPSEPHTEQVLPGTPPPEVLPPQQADEAREKAAQEERDRETVAAGAGPTVQERSDAAERLKQHVDSELESARKDDSQGGRKLAAVPEPTEPSAPERPDWLGKVETGDEGWFKATAAAAASKRSAADVRAELAQLTDAKILATRGQGFDLEYRIVPKSTREVNKDLLSLESVRDWVVEQKEPFAGTHYLKAKNLPPGSSPKISAHLQTLGRQGVIERPEGSPSVGRSARWVYVPPPNNAPTTRPRGEQRMTAVDAPKRGTVVPHTGAPIGRSGRPGLDRKRAGQGKRIARSGAKAK